MAGDAELLVNPGGDLRHAAFKQRARRAVYIDVDPGFTQLWLASGRPVPRVEGHDLHFTIGENVGTPASDLPTAGIEWRHTRQPVVLDEWPFAEELADAALHHRRALARNRSARFPRRHRASRSRRKATSSSACSTFPNEPASPSRSRSTRAATTSRAGCSSAHGWSVVEPASVAADPDSFRRYVQGSWAEFSVAKGTYVETSTRLVQRAHRPLSRLGPAGARAGHRLLADAARGRGARSRFARSTKRSGVRSASPRTTRATEGQRGAIAEEYFDSDELLTRLLEDAT